MGPTIIFFGGTSSERRVSVASAQHLASYLTDAVLWFQNSSGVVQEVSTSELKVHEQPFTTDFRPAHFSQVWANLSLALDEAKNRGAVLFLALHGGSGEDGTIQEQLEARHIPFTGSSAAASRLAIDKIRTKDCVAKAGVRVAQQVMIGEGAGVDAQMRLDLADRFERWHGLVLKPVRDGSSFGLHIIRQREGLASALNAVALAKMDYMAEELLDGRELTVGVLSQKSSLKGLPISEVCTEAGATFDYEGKYLGLGTKEITPAAVSPEIAHAAQELAMKAHRAIGAYGYTRCDMILTKNELVFLEINTLPGLSRASFIPQQLHAAAISMKDFIAAQLLLAQERY